MKLPQEYYNKLNTEQLSFLQSFFAKCPDSFSSNIMLMTYPKNHILINTDDECAYVYILLEGRLQAIEERVINAPYSFTEISAIDIVGDFELFTKLSTRIITLTTLEKSLCLVIPASDYLAFIQNDAKALFIRTQMLIKELIAQTKFDRQNLFLDNRTRFLHFLYGECNRKSQDSFPILIKYTRQEIASKLGCSIRTINRIIQGLNAEGLLELKHGKIYIDISQYKTIHNYIDNAFMANQLLPHNEKPSI